VQVPRTLGIGETGDVVVALDKQTPAGPWLARMTLRSGYVEHAVTATLSFPTAAGTSAAPVRATPVSPLHDRGVVVPLAIGLIIALLLALALLLWWRRRRRGTGEPAVVAVPSQRPSPQADHVEAR
jgi:LPXTG-motif cell wall-anchored protein